MSTSAHKSAAASAGRVADLDWANDQVADAPLYWVTPEMTVAAWDASIDLPDWTPAGAAPSDSGLLLWARPLPPIPPEQTAQHEDPYPGTQISGVLWSIQHGYLQLLVIARTQHLPENERAAISEQITPIADMSPRPAKQPIGLDDHALDAGFIAVIGATWLLMQQPAVGSTHTINGAGGSGRSWTREERHVTLVDLKRLTEHQTPAADPTGRTYTHRWIVRGHWRQQAHGPGRTLRRPTWVPSHIKGPADAPLLEKDTVWVWRR